MHRLFFQLCAEHNYTRTSCSVQGKMQWLWDDKGKRYLDLFAGIVTVSVGHCHPKVSEALRTQVGKLWHTTATYLTEPVHEYAEKLTSRLPGNLKVNVEMKKCDRAFIRIYKQKRKAT